SSAPCRSQAARKISRYSISCRASRSFWRSWTMSTPPASTASRKSGRSPCRVRASVQRYRRARSSRARRETARSEGRCLDTVDVVPFLEDRGSCRIAGPRGGHVPPHGPAIVSCAPSSAVPGPGARGAGAPLERADLEGQRLGSPADLGPPVLGERLHGRAGQRVVGGEQPADRLHVVVTRVRQERQGARQSLDDLAVLDEGR